MAVGRRSAIPDRETCYSSVYYTVVKLYQQVDKCQGFY